MCTQLHISFKVLELEAVPFCSVFRAGTAEGARREDQDVMRSNVLR